MQRPLLLAFDESSMLEDLREHAARAISNGFDGIEWRLPVGSSPPLPANSQLDTMHIGALAIRCEMMDIPSAVRFVSSQLQAATSLAASVLNLSIPPMRLGSKGQGFSRYQDALNFAYELLRQVRLEAEARGVSIALVAATGGCLLSSIELRELIDAVNSPAVGVCLDVERIGTIGSPLDWIQTLHRRVKTVCYADVPCVGGSFAAQASLLRMEILIQALDGIHSDCPLILSGPVADSKFAGRRCDG